jgi:hypothetical protein
VVQGAIPLPGSTASIPAALDRGDRFSTGHAVAPLASPWAVGEIVAAIRLCAGMPESLELDTLLLARLCVLPGAAGPRAIDPSPAEFAVGAVIRGGETLAAAAARAGPSLDRAEALAALRAGGAVSGPADDP